MPVWKLALRVGMNRGMLNKMFRRGVPYGLHQNQSQLCEALRGGWADEPNEMSRHDDRCFLVRYVHRRPGCGANSCAAQAKMRTDTKIRTNYVHYACRT